MLTFFVSITSLLLDIQKANYTDPSSGTEIFVSTWRNTVDNLYDLTVTGLARFTQGKNTSNVDVELKTQLASLTNYLLKRGYTSSFTITKFSIGNTLAPSSYSIDVTYLVILKDAKNTLNQTLNVPISFSASKSGSYITLLKTSNGQVEPIADATITVVAPGTSTVTNLRDGRYLLSVPGDTFDIVTPEGIKLQV